MIKVKICKKCKIDVEECGCPKFRRRASEKTKAQRRGVINTLINMRDKGRALNNFTFANINIPKEYHMNREEANQRRDELRKKDEIEWRSGDLHNNSGWILRW